MPNNIPTDLEFGKYFVISTSHISQKESAWFCDKDKDHPFVIYDFEEGFWLHINTDKGWLDELKQHYPLLPPHIIRIIEIALETGCNFVKFDCDGPEYEQLETFKW